MDAKARVDVAHADSFPNEPGTDEMDPNVELLLVNEREQFLSYARRFCVRTDSPEDVLQEAEMTLRTKRFVYTSDPKARAYIKKQIRWTAQNRGRREYGQRQQTAKSNKENKKTVYAHPKRASGGVEKVSQADDLQPTPLDSMIQSELESRLHEVLDSLTEREREAIRRRFWNNESFNEIASAMEITGGAAYGLVRTAKTTIKKVLKRYDH